MAMWWQKQKNEQGEEQLAIPKELEDQIKEGAEGAKKISKLETLLEDLVSTQQQEKKDRDDAAKAVRDAAARKQAESQSGELDEKIEELLLTNPREAIRLATAGQTEAIKAVHADSVRREVFEDQTKFKYYSGDVKREVDALIASQGVDFRLNPANIENCYLTVIGKHADEIAEGKIKTRFAGSESGSRGTASGNAGDTSSGAAPRTYDAETMKAFEKAAKVTGLTVKDYVEMYEKEEVV